MAHPDSFRPSSPSVASSSPSSTGPAARPSAPALEMAAASLLLDALATLPGSSLTPELALDVCLKTGLTQNDELKRKARRLREALAGHGIDLRHTRALELVSHMLGHASYMHSQQHAEKHWFVIKTDVEGIEGKLQPFPSMGEALTALLSAAFAQMPNRDEPAYCSLGRNRESFSLQVQQAHSAWFSCRLTHMVETSGSNAEAPVELREMEPGMFAAALRKVVDNLESARPTALVLYGTLPGDEEGGEATSGSALPPWFGAGFRLTSIEANTEQVISDERELFTVFESIDAHTVKAERGDCLVVGDSGTLRVEVCWVDLTGNVGSNIPPSSVGAVPIVKRLMERYRRYSHALSSRKLIREAVVSDPALHGPVIRAILELGSGRGQLQWHARLDHGRLREVASKKNWSDAELARVAGVRYRDVARLSDSDVAAPELVAKVARALRVSPESLLKGGGLLGFEPDNGAQLMRMLDGAMAYSSVEGNSIEPGRDEEVSEFLIAAKDLSEMASFTYESPEHFEEEAQALLDALRQAGLKLIIAREVRFVATGQKSKEGDSEFMAMNVVTFCMETAERGMSALWTPAGK